jgi:hypothetical protein
MTTFQVSVNRGNSWRSELVTYNEVNVDEGLKKIQQSVSNQITENRLYSKIRQ